MIVVHGTTVHGRPVDGATRCVHYRGPRDVVAILLRCCRRWYPCVHCHDEEAEHPRAVWSAASAETVAILCGVCGARLSIATYRGVAACPSCAADFNPGCARHHPLYFA